jgi:polygalacturonase
VRRRTFFGAAAGAACAVGVRAQPPVRTEGWYNVRDQGATGDGATDDTKAIQTAIDQCSRTGGRVVFPPGRYRTGMVRLKSHITIELSNQAVWQAIPDLTLYPDLPIRSAAPAFLYAGNEEEIHITGEGKIHGSGDAHNVFVPGPNLSKGPRAPTASSCTAAAISLFPASGSRIPGSGCCGRRNATTSSSAV